MTDFLGRRTERADVEQLLAGAQAGVSGVVVVCGEAGIGKTVLLEHARHIAEASGFQVVSSIGVESESQFAYAGLHRLCAPLLDHSGMLPDPQQAALNVALGLVDGAPPDRFLVGLATLNLLADVVEEAPLLCLVDDVQWLDEASAQVIAFVARRVAAERVALVLARRDSSDDDANTFAGFPELRLDGLDETDARALLASSVFTPLDDEVRERIVAEARGNPLALLEFPRNVQPGQLAGGFELPDALSVPRRIEDSFQRRSDTLPPETRMLMLIAAAEPTGDVTLLWRALDHLGIGRDAITPAENAGLLEINSKVRFRHPLVRSAVYRAATPSDQRRAHGALAIATDRLVDADRHAWHSAQAVVGTNEEVAAALERSARRARARGGLAAGAAFLQYAAELTPDSAIRARRTLEAAHTKYEAGAFKEAQTLLDAAAIGPLDPLQRATIQMLRGQIAFHLTRGREVPEILLNAADTMAPLDAPLAIEVYVEALEASFHAGRFVPDQFFRDIATAARSAPMLQSAPSRSVDLLFKGLAMRFTLGYEASVPDLKNALESLRSDDDWRWLWLACHVAVMLWDDESLVVLASRAVQLAREAGAWARLPAALNALGSVLVLTGELARAEELFEEEDAITRATGVPPLPNSRLVLASWLGRPLHSSELLKTIVEDGTARGEGLIVSSVEMSIAVLDNGLGNYEGALDAATRLFAFDELAHGSLVLPELVEAAVRAGHPTRAEAALELLNTRAASSGTNWGLGLAARSRALTGTGPDIEEHYREAIERLSNSRIAVHLARARLLYGEWLRREGRRQDARGQLRTAHELLSDMGASAFAARAARELRATGEHPRKRASHPADALTAQEAHIARLVATGATNREVGAQLFLSPRTIEAHLRNIFQKLDITSRRQLRDLRLPGPR